MAKVTLNERSIRRAPPAVGQIELRDLYTPGFGLRIAAGGARTYFAMRRVNGKMVRRTVGRAHIGEGPPAPGELLLADARSKARLILSDLQRGIDSQGDLAARAVRKTENARYAKAAAIAEDLCAASAASRTFAAVSANYFADPSKRGGASLRSRAELERKVRVDLAAWHDLSIDAITRQEIRAVVKRKARTSPVSANRLLALIRRILRWAVREEIIAGNPATDIDPPAQETERARVLTLEELARIWAGCDVLGYPFGPIIKILILTAQRRSEVGSLRWSEINESVWRLPDLRAKRGKGHLIPLSPRAVAILAAVVKVGDNPELVFTTGRRRFPPAPGEKVVPAPVGGWSRA
jgi:integrase